jgi:hypothetical protein
MEEDDRRREEEERLKAAEQLARQMEERQKAEAQARQEAEAAEAAKEQARLAAVGEAEQAKAAEAAKEQARLAAVGKARFARLLALSLAVLLIGAIGAGIYFIYLAGTIQNLADDNQRKADDNQKLAEDNQRKADDNQKLAEDNQRKAKEAQDQRDVANRHLARVFFEKADRAGLYDSLGSRLLFAKSLTLDDNAETRQRLLTAQSIPVRLLWSSLRQPVGNLLAASPDGSRVVMEDGVYDLPRSVVLWDATAGREVATYSQAAVVATWSPDGQWLATVDSRANVILRQPAGTKPPLYLRLTDADTDAFQHRPPLLAFTSDGSRLTMLSPLGIESRFVGCQWEVSTGAVVKKYRGQLSPRFASAWALHPRGRYLALALYFYCGPYSL